MTTTIVSTVTDMCLENVIETMSPIAYWPLNEISGGTAVNHGSLGSDVDGTYNSVSLAQTEAPGGGCAPYFDGTNSWVTVYSTTLRDNFPLSKGTILAWCRLESYGGWDWILYFMNDSSNEGLEIRDNGTDSLYYGYTSGFNKTISFTPNVWRLVAITYDDDINESYWCLNDSKTYGGVAVTLNANFLSSYGTGIGGRWNGWRIDGYIAHAAIWDRALSSEEIALIYNVGSS